MMSRVRVSFVLSVVFVTTLLLVAGCGQGTDQSSALEEQRRENEELRRALEDQERERERAEDREAAEAQEEMQQKIDDLEQQVAEEGSEPQQTELPEQESGQPEAVIESNPNWTADPSDAPEGVVVVSPDYNVQAVSSDEAGALDAAIAYYQAVETGDYYATHRLLSVDDQDIFPVDDWVAANTSLDSAAGEFVVTGVYPGDVGNYSPTYTVTLAVYLPDGSSFDRTTYFTDEGNGYWAHWLSQEEMELFSGAL